MNPDPRRVLATGAGYAAGGAGAASLAIGAALITRPGEAAAVLGMPGLVGPARALGALDVAIGAGLLSGRRRREWMVARVALNGTLAARYRRPLAGAPLRMAARRRQLATVMTSLTVIDGAIALAQPRTRDLRPLLGRARLSRNYGVVCGVWEW